MPARICPPQFKEISSQWLDLAERRLAYYSDLYRSGRWQLYYTADIFSVRVIDVMKAVAIWRELAEQAPPSEKSDLRSVA